MKMSKFKGLIAVTLCLIVITVLGIVYEKSMPIGRFDSEGTKMFRLCETELSEPYFELKAPLDNWTAQAVQNLTQCVWVKEQYWNQCQITNFLFSTEAVFKYGEKFYTHDMHTSRRVEIHVDPLNEVNCGVAISLCKSASAHSIINPFTRACYELHDPLDPWTEAAIEDPINMVYVDDIYLDQCALLKPNVTTILEQRPAYKYDGEYYTRDLFAFYDGFRPISSYIGLLTIISWVVLGCFWLGSALNEAYPYLKRRFKKKPTESVGGVFTA
ncbi:MAG: hypothetical protein OEZ21_07610 [Candidatus Bathyarchaeota archaeon]|nr:hypothetical protein [Candidatus Bathyarchaeota archaeon]